MEIINMLALSREQREQCAALLCRALPGRWPTQPCAAEEIARIDRPESSVLALVEGGQVTALGGLIPGAGERSLWLHPLAVEPALQGQGRGRRLLSALENVARARYARSLQLTCREGEAADFFLHMGYEPGEAGSMTRQL